MYVVVTTNETAHTERGMYDAPKPFVTAELLLWKLGAVLEPKSAEDYGEKLRNHGIEVSNRTVQRWESEQGNVGPKRWIDAVELLRLAGFLDEAAIRKAQVTFAGELAVIQEQQAAGLRSPKMPSRPRYRKEI